MNNPKPTDTAEYLDELTNLKGVGVVTVKDGWVMMFTKERLTDLLAASEQNGKVVVFIKRSDLIPKN